MPRLSSTADLILTALSESDNPLTMADLRKRFPDLSPGAISGCLNRLLAKKMVVRGGTHKHYYYIYTYTEQGMSLLQPSKSAPLAPPICGPSAEDIVAAIFLQIEANLEEIKRLKERNQLLEEESIQLRQYIGDLQKKPVKLPPYISSALAVHGEEGR